MPKVKYTCLYCSSDIYDYSSRHRKFCNKTCFDRWQIESAPREAQSIHWKGGLPKCIDCGKELGAYKSQRCKSCAARIHATKKLGWFHGGKVKHICQWCSAEIWDFPCRDRVFCNTKCFGEWKAVNWRGANGPTWRGGISTSPYDTLFTDRFKKGIRKRDEYKCAVCWLYGYDVHHINYDKMDTREGNCMILCRKCHMITNYNRSYWQSALTQLMQARGYI